MKPCSLARLECGSDKAEVGGSNPPMATIYERNREVKELFAKLETNDITKEEISRLEDADFILYYDGYHITKLGWLYLLQGQVPEQEIRHIVMADKEEYKELVKKLKEKNL